MNRPKWLQDDLRIIAKWWSTRIMLLGIVSNLLIAGVAAMVPGYEMREWLGTYFVPAEAILFAAGIAAQAYRQKNKADSAADQPEADENASP